MILDVYNCWGIVDSNVSFQTISEYVHPKFRDQDKEMSLYKEWQEGRYAIQLEHIRALH